LSASSHPGAWYAHSSRQILQALDPQEALLSLDVIGGLIRAA
jgi:hypothetical protein